MRGKNLFLATATKQPAVRSLAGILFGLAFAELILNRCGGRLIRISALAVGPLYHFLDYVGLYSYELCSVLAVLVVAVLIFAWLSDRNERATFRLSLALFGNLCLVLLILQLFSRANLAAQSFAGDARARERFAPAHFGEQCAAPTATRDRTHLVAIPRFTSSLNIACVVRRESASPWSSTHKRCG